MNRLSYTFKQWLTESGLSGDAMRLAAAEVRRQMPHDFRHFAQDYTTDGKYTVWELRIEYEPNELLNPTIYEKLLKNALAASGVSAKDASTKHTSGTKPDSKICRLTVKVPQ